MKIVTTEMAYVGQGTVTGQEPAGGSSMGSTAPWRQDPSMLGRPELPPPTKRKREVGNQPPPEVFGEGRFLQQLGGGTNISHVESLLEALWGYPSSRLHGGARDLGLTPCEHSVSLTPTGDQKRAFLLRAWRNGTISVLGLLAAVICLQLLVAVWPPLSEELPENGTCPRKSSPERWKERSARCIICAPGPSHA